MKYTGTNARHNRLVKLWRRWQKEIDEKGIEPETIAERDGYTKNYVYIRARDVREGRV